MHSLSDLWLTWRAGYQKRHSLANRFLNGTGFQLNLRFPAFAVFAGPQFLRVAVVEDFSGALIDVEGVASAVGYVAEVAQERALLTFFDGGARFLAGADAIEKIPEASASLRKGDITASHERPRSVERKTRAVLPPVASQAFCFPCVIKHVPLAANPPM